MEFDRSRIRLLVIILFAACFAVAGVVFAMLWGVFIDGQKARLGDSVRAQASLMSAIARQARLDTPLERDWKRYALIEILSAQKDFAGFGETGEFTFGARDGDSIIFYLRHRHFDVEQPLPVDWNSGRATPMRAALEGGTGVGMGTDYRGAEVLAAFQPVPELDMGLVAKIDMAELRNPFITTSFAAFLVGLMVVVAGSLMFSNVTMPMLNRLRISERRYRDLIEHMRDGVAVLKSTGASDFTYVEINAAAERIDGLDRAEVIGQTFGTLFPAAAELGLLDAVQRVHTSGQPETLPMSFYQDDRISGWRDHRFYRLPSGEVVHVYADVTARKRAEAGLLMAAAVFQHTGEGILVTDVDGIIQRVNPAFSEITGYSSEEAVGKNPSILKSDRQAPDFYRTMWTELRGSGRWQGELWNRRKNGEAFLEWLTINAVHDDQGAIAHYVAVFDDISELHEKEQRIRHQAYHDALTGLPNRTLLIDRLDHFMAASDRGDLHLAVLFLDLDRFKVVNDSLGHDVGDELLKAVGQHLKLNLRKADTVARLGGDEFVVLCTSWQTPAEVSQVADKVLGLLKAPFTVAGHELHVGCSMGVALYPTDGRDARTLLKNADTAMYAVKEEGRDGYRFFDASMNALAMERLTLETALRHALERGEFQLYYQPKVRLATGRMVGMEALIRWFSPDGMVPPDRFIPLAEETGLVVPIGEWVLREACRQVRQWRDGGLEPGAVAVNVSARQLSQADFAARVAAIFREEMVDPDDIDLEITETAIMREPERAAAQLAELAANGVRIVLDDFGVGHSSLGYLKRLPISVLKMDRSFISDVLDNHDAAALARGIVGLAKALDIQVVAEGVETAQQADFLRACGCDLAQGYLYARPLAADKVRAEFIEAVDA